MAVLIAEFPISTDLPTSVMVEVITPDGGPQRVGRAGDLAHKAKKTLEEALENLRPAITTLSSVLHDINNPAEIGIEFGVKLTTDLGAVIAATGAEVNFTIKVVWKNQG